MQMKKYMNYVAEATEVVTEVMPWDLDEELEEGAAPLVLDIREPYEFDCMHIEGSHNVPRGVLERACEWDYEETIPELAKAREREIVVVCRSGHRSLLAAKILKEMGYTNVRSLKTGLRGWNDYEMPLVRHEDEEPVREINADRYFAPNVRKDQLKPKS
jgi:rhodanese-related sulfurtransferase